MTQEDKQLLLKDLCARLPYGVKVKVKYHYLYNDGSITNYKGDETLDEEHLQMLREKDEALDLCKPYLRPMSSMTEEEDKEYTNIDNGSYTCPKDLAHFPASKRIDWLNAHHFDYRGLIPLGLAIAVTEENNPYKD